MSFGSDAHQPWRVGDKFKLAVNLVEAAGFRAGRDRFISGAGKKALQPSVTSGGPDARRRREAWAAAGGP